VLHLLACPFTLFLYILCLYLFIINLPFLVNKSFIIYTFLIEVPMIPLSLVKIGQIVRKWQQLFEIQDESGHLLDLWLRRFFDVTADVF